MTSGYDTDPYPIHPMAGWWERETLLDITILVLTGYDGHHKANGTYKSCHRDRNERTIGNTVQSPSLIIHFRNDKGRADTGY